MYKIKKNLRFEYIINKYIRGGRRRARLVFYNLKILKMKLSKRQLEALVDKIYIENKEAIMAKEKKGIRWS